LGRQRRVLLGQLDHRRQVLELAREAIEQVELAGQLRPLRAHLAGGAGVVPEAGCGDLEVELLDAGAQRIGVKGNHGPRPGGPSTARRRPRDPRAPGAVRSRRTRPWRVVDAVPADRRRARYAAIWARIDGSAMRSSAASIWAFDRITARRSSSGNGRYSFGVA